MLKWTILVVVIVILSREMIPPSDSATITMYPRNDVSLVKSNWE